MIVYKTIKLKTKNETDVQNVIFIGDLCVRMCNYTVVCE